MNFGSLFSSSKDEEFSFPIHYKQEQSSNSIKTIQTSNEEELVIIKCDTYLERIEKEKKMSIEELQIENDSYKNDEIQKIEQVKCSFCDNLADVTVSPCKHSFCQNCFDMTQCDQSCMVEECQKKYDEALFLKNGKVIKF